MSQKQNQSDTRPQGSRPQVGRYTNPIGFLPPLDISRQKAAEHAEQARQWAVLVEVLERLEQGGEQQNREVAKKKS